MRRSLQYSIHLLLAGMIPAFYCQAQQSFLYKAVLLEVKTPGFHKVMLHPSVVSKCRQDLGDIRIFDNNAQQVPYLVRKVMSNAGEQYLQLPSPVIAQTDSVNKTSYISISMNEEYWIDKLELNVQGPRFYKRRIIIQKNTHYSSSSLITSSIQSGTAAGIPLGLKAKQLTLVIENDDNPPLAIRAVSAWQLRKFLLAYLEPGKTYQLAFGDANAPVPRYDLEFFKDSISEISDTVSSGPVIKNTPAPAVMKQPGVQQIDLMLWIIIGAVLLVLLALTLRLTKEVNQKETR